eukprot:TRINITY_DN7314_c0_g1_i1.p1 TRINITY_DN7314_c0_g1~~TRINITY_DN7314_c0_g1_i1.p1  ORF type:complete len:338 (-),score=54.19 TRINITY_DN7314_c0_g1_i1:1410-2423(-)
MAKITAMLKTFALILLAFVAGCFFWEVVRSSSVSVSSSKTGAVSLSFESSLFKERRGVASGEGETCHDWLTPHAKLDPWRSGMKWAGRAALCPVSGFTIETLEAENNFRRGFAYGFSKDVEDKTHVIPFFRAFRDLSLHTRERRVLLDLGAKDFWSSTSFLLRSYPLDFTEVHAFEVNDRKYAIPKEHDNKVDVAALKELTNATFGRRYPLPNWMLRRITRYTAFVAERDGSVRFRGKKVPMVNITRFIKEEARLTAEDAVIVKMDIEGTEWPILQEWIEDEEMASIIDEIFVEVHYHHASMAKFGWDKQTYPHSREEALQLLITLRKKGYFVHPWP